MNELIVKQQKGYPGHRLGWMGSRIVGVSSPQIFFNNALAVAIGICMRIIYQLIQVVNHLPSIWHLIAVGIWIVGA